MKIDLVKVSIDKDIFVMSKELYEVNKDYEGRWIDKSVLRGYGSRFRGDARFGIRN